MILRHTTGLFVQYVFLAVLLCTLVFAKEGRVYTHSSLAGRAKPEYIAKPAHDLLCRPFGECEPCPKDELDQPFCLPFGNRRLLHCLPANQLHQGGEGGDHKQPPGEVPAWESCGKVIRQEKQSFWEFVIVNLLFLIVALSILWGRSSALAAAQYRQLAARIGIPGSNWRA